MQFTLDSHKSGIFFSRKLHESFAIMMFATVTAPSVNVVAIFT